MKIREKAMESLVLYGMFEHQAVEIIDKYLASSFGEMMRERIDDDESDYPPRAVLCTMVRTETGCNTVD
jgi:hypothetical protein